MHVLQHIIHVKPAPSTRRCACCCHDGKSVAKTSAGLPIRSCITQQQCSAVQHLHMMEWTFRESSAGQVRPHCSWSGDSGSVCTATGAPLGAAAVNADAAAAAAAAAAGDPKLAAVAVAVAVAAACGVPAAAAAAAPSPGCGSLICWNTLLTARAAASCFKACAIAPHGCHIRSTGSTCVAVVSAVKVAVMGSFLGR